MTLFSILLPTHDHGTLIEWPIKSVLQQTEPSWELIIIGDGCPAETKKLVAKYQKTDKRIKFVDKPKGPRHGEVYRHEAISNLARGKFVSYLSDDDLYFADHLEKLAAGFASGANFISTLAVKVSAVKATMDEKAVDSMFRYFPVDLASTYYKQLLLSGENRVPLSNGAHTMALYRNLPHGWRTTPPGLPTDLYMWQQILHHQQTKPSTLFEPSILNFASPERQAWSTNRRSKELQTWFSKISKNSGTVRQIIAQSLLSEVSEFEPHALKHSVAAAELQKIYDSKVGWLVKNYFKIKQLLAR